MLLRESMMMSRRSPDAHCLAATHAPEGSVTHAPLACAYVPWDGMAPTTTVLLGALVKAVASSEGAGWASAPHDERRTSSAEAERTNNLHGPILQDLTHPVKHVGASCVHHSDDIAPASADRATT